MNDVATPVASLIEPIGVDEPRRRVVGPFVSGSNKRRFLQSEDQVEMPREIGAYPAFRLAVQFFHQDHIASMNC